MSAPTDAPTPSAVYLQREFLERLAHEVRGPVGVTSGALDEIERGIAGDAEELRIYFLMARRGMQRVLRLAERLERTAQLESGDVEWAMAPTDLRPLTELAARETERLEARRGVNVTVSCSEAPCPVAADQPWMHLAVSELVGNAIRFARSAVSIRCEIAGDDITVTIADDGPGFSGTPARRFEPPSDKRGIGLSLPLVRDVVAAHGGRLDLHGPPSGEDTALSGARVVIALPRARLLLGGDPRTKP